MLWKLGEGKDKQLLGFSSVATERDFLLDNIYQLILELEENKTFKKVCSFIVPGMVFSTEIPNNIPGKDRVNAEKEHITQGML